MSIASTPAATVLVAVRPTADLAEGDADRHQLILRREHLLALADDCRSSRSSRASLLIGNSRITIPASAFDAALGEIGGAA